jgi:hypothetical protein
MDNTESESSFFQPHSQPHKLKFTHPIKEVYVGITDDEIECVINKINDETDYESPPGEIFNPVPSKVFAKYYSKYLLNKMQTKGEVIKN